MEKSWIFSLCIANRTENPSNTAHIRWMHIFLHKLHTQSRTYIPSQTNKIKKQTYRRRGRPLAFHRNKSFLVFVWKLCVRCALINYTHTHTIQRDEKEVRIGRSAGKSRQIERQSKHDVTVERLLFGCKRPTQHAKWAYIHIIQLDYVCENGRNAQNSTSLTRFCDIVEYAENNMGSIYMCLLHFRSFLLTFLSLFFCHRYYMYVHKYTKVGQFIETYFAKDTSENAPYMCLESHMCWPRVTATKSIERLN